MRDSSDPKIPGGAKSAIRKALQIALYPWFRFFGPRFSNILVRLDEANVRLTRLDQTLANTENRTATNLETISEFALTLQRAAWLLNDRAAALEDSAIRHVAKEIMDSDPDLVDTAAATLVGVDISKIGPGAAALLNWAATHQGASAQADLWFNPPVSVEIRPGEVVPAVVNERIVEIPFAMATAGRLPVNSRVLDVGAAESTLALSLACLGLDVTAIDPRGYPLDHSRLSVVTDPVETWGGPSQIFDAIFCISTIEHLGVGAYGQQALDHDLDRFVIERFASWLGPEGELIITAPYGQWSVNEFQRTYDAEHLDRLLKGWRVLDKRVCIQAGDLAWEPLKEESGQAWNPDRRAVVMVRARKGT